MEGTYPILIDNKEVGSLKVKKIGLMTEFEGYCEDNGDVLRLSVYGDTEGYLGVMIPDNGRLCFRKKLSKNSMKGFPNAISYAAPAGGNIQKLENNNIESVNENLEKNRQESIDENKVRKEKAETEEKKDRDKDNESDARVISKGKKNDADSCEEETDSKKTKSEQQESVKETATKDKDSKSDVSSKEDKDLSGIEKKEPKEQKKEKAAVKKDLVWRPIPNPWSLVSGASTKAAMSEARGVLTTSVDEKILLAIPKHGDNKIFNMYDTVDTREIEGVEYLILEIKDGKISTSY